MELICVKDYITEDGTRLFTENKVYSFVEFLGAIIVHDDEFNEHDVNGRLRGLGRWDKSMLDYFDDVPEEKTV